MTATTGKENERGMRQAFSSLGHPLVLAILLAAATLGAFYPTISHQFVNFDDPDYFTVNDHVRSGLTREGVAWAFSTGYSGNWHPLTWISLMMDAQWFGARPAGPHGVNLAWHIANVILLFLVLNRMTRAVWASASVAALFALHPLHVESVAWVAERKDVLSTFFFLLTLLAYEKYVDNSEDRGAKLESEDRVESAEAGRTTQPRRAGDHVARPGCNSGLRGYYLLTLIFFALGLMSKPMLVTLPFILLLLDYWPLKRLGPKPSLGELYARVSEKLPFFLLTALSCVITFIVQKRSGAVQSLGNLSSGQRLENAVVSYVRYLGKMLWPAGLATPYPHPGHWPWELVLFAVVTVLGLSLGAWIWRRQWPFVTVGWFWFFGMLVPVIGLVQVGAQSMADRYTYVPLIGLFIAVVWTGREALKRLARWQPLVSLMTAAILVLCAVCTRNQLAHWQNSETLFRHAIQVTKSNWLAEYNLGWFLDGEHRFDEALACYRQAVTFKPNCGEAWNNMGFVLAERKQYREASDCFERALQARPDLVDARNNLGRALDELGRTDDAIAQYRLALQHQPANVGTINNLALALTRKGQFGDAVPLYERGLLLEPNQPVAHYNLANALARLGRSTEAIAQYQAAIRLKPDYALAQHDLGIGLMMTGHPAEGLQHLREAVRLKPDDATFRCNFGKMLASQQRLDEAIPQFEEALRLAPTNADAHNALGSAWATQGKINDAINEFQAALRYRPDSFSTHFNLGKALASQSRKEEAVKQFEEALRLNPNFTPAREELQALGVGLVAKPEKQEPTPTGNPKE